MKWVYILLFTCLIAFRFAYLDQDAPGYQFANICQEDEPYYCQGAMMKLCANENRNVKGFEKAKGETIDMYNRYFSFASLKIFGNTYWGLRIPCVLASLLFVLLIYSIFKSISSGDRFIPVLVILLFTNFYLYVFSRYYTPQIFSVFFITLTLWIIIKYGYEKPLPLIGSGFAATFSVLFVYPMNFFLLAGVGLFVLIKCIIQKRISIILFFLLGIILCFLCYVSCLSSLGYSISSVFSMVSTYGKSHDVISSTNSTQSVFGNIVKSIVSIVATGYFRFDLSLLFSTVVALPLLVFKAFKKGAMDRGIALLMLSVIACQLIQNYFAITYPFKKMLVDIPITVISIFIVVKDFDLKKWTVIVYKKWLMFSWLLLALLVCLFNFKVNKSAVYWSYFGTGCYETTPGWFDIANITGSVVLMLVMLYSLFASNARNQLWVKFAFVISIIANSALAYNSFVINRKFQIRDCLVSLEPMLHNEVVSGGFPFEYQLYTNCKPVLHGYAVDELHSSRKVALDSMLTNRKIDFIIEKGVPGIDNCAQLYPKLELVRVYNFNCYSYFLFKNKPE